jgi:hypothetical protein
MYLSVNQEVCMSNFEGFYEIKCNAKVDTVKLQKSASKVFRNGYSNWDGTKWIPAWLVTYSDKSFRKSETRKQALLDAACKIGEKNWEEITRQEIEWSAKKIRPLDS